VYERQVEYWTSRGIEDFYWDNGFEVVVMPLTQLTEKIVPADFIFKDQGTRKLFGFQFKALYSNGDDFWNIDKSQHEALQHFDWMYYGLSDLNSASQQRTALHYLRIVRPGFSYSARVTRKLLHDESRYFRWAAFYEGVRDCKFGRRVCTSAELSETL